MKYIIHGQSYVDIPVLLCVSECAKRLTSNKGNLKASAYSHILEFRIVCFNLCGKSLVKGISTYNLIAFQG